MNTSSKTLYLSVDYKEFHPDTYSGFKVTVRYDADCKPYEPPPPITDGILRLPKERRKYVEVDYRFGGKSTDAVQDYHTAISVIRNMISKDDQAYTLSSFDNFVHESGLPFPMNTESN